MKSFFTISLIITTSFCLGQKTIQELKIDLIENLNEFEIQTKDSIELDYIDIEHFYFLIEQLDTTILKDFDKIDSNSYFHGGISSNKHYSTLSYYFSIQYNNIKTHYTRNCNKTLDGTFTTFKETIHQDTLSNVILTHPKSKKYIYYTSKCPSGLTKKEALINFKKRLYGRYQLIIYFTHNKFSAYFVTPPNPKEKIRIKHKSLGKF